MGLTLYTGFSFFKNDHPNQSWDGIQTSTKIMKFQVCIAFDPALIYTTPVLVVLLCVGGLEMEAIAKISREAAY